MDQRRLIQLLQSGARVDLKAPAKVYALDTATFSLSVVFEGALGEALEVADAEHVIIVASGTIEGSDRQVLLPDVIEALLQKRRASRELTPPESLASPT